MWNGLPRWFKRLKNTSRDNDEFLPNSSTPSPFTDAEKSIATSNPKLLDQIRSDWQDGNYDALSKICADELIPYPDRARLALLVAAANEQCGHSETAQEFLELAKKWGANNREISRLLISRVHGILGRARLLSNFEKEAQQHFSQSLLEKKPPEIDKTSAYMRMQNEAKLLKLDERPTRSQDHSHNQINSETNRVDLSESFQALGTDLKTTIKNESAKAMRQLEAYFGIQSYLTHGQLTPALHGWPVSPDFGYYLLQTVESYRYDLIIEFGSGTSTLLVASVLENIRKRSTTTELTTQLAFEHLPKYFKQTQEMLTKFSLANSVQLVLTELTEQKDEFDEKKYNYYKCKNILEEISNTAKSERILVIVDGPPASTGKHARYPAIPLILKYFPSAEIDVLLDDFGRQDEKEIVQKWTKILKDQSRVFQHNEIHFEKGASHLHIEKTS